MTTLGYKLNDPSVAPNPELAPEWDVEQWFNTDRPIDLASLRGRVVALHAFQMLCPGCVSDGLVLARQMHASLGKEVAVIGIHTVFEHHEAMRPVSLEAFLHEYRIEFPVGVDRPSEDGAIPSTMKRYRMRGTPSLLLFDRAGSLRAHLFGRVSPLAVGVAVGQLLAEPTADCADGACAVSVT